MNQKVRSLTNGKSTCSSGTSPRPGKSCEVGPPSPSHFASLAIKIVPSFVRHFAPGARSPPTNTPSINYLHLQDSFLLVCQNRRSLFIEPALPLQKIHPNPKFESSHCTESRAQRRATASASQSLSSPSRDVDPSNELPAQSKSNKR